MPVPLNLASRNAAPAHGAALLLRPGAMREDRPGVAPAFSQLILLSPISALRIALV
jgi:hypothetical protein